MISTLKGLRSRRTESWSFFGETGWVWTKHFPYEGLIHPIALDLCAAKNLSNMNILESFLYDFPAEKNDQEGSESVLINLLTSWLAVAGSQQTGHTRLVQTFRFHDLWFDFVEDDNTRFWNEFWSVAVVCPLKSSKHLIFFSYGFPTLKSRCFPPFFLGSQTTWRSGWVSPPKCWDPARIERGEDARTTVMVRNVAGNNARKEIFHPWIHGVWRALRTPSN